MYEYMLKCICVFAFFAQVGQIEATEARNNELTFAFFQRVHLCHLYISEIVWTKSLNVFMSIEKLFSVCVCVCVCVCLCVCVKKQTIFYSDV